MKVTLKAVKENRRWVVGEQVVGAGQLRPPFQMRDAESGEGVACQWEAGEDGGNVVKWVVPVIEGGKARTFVLEHAEKAGDAGKDGVTLKEDAGGWLGVNAGGREITRYHFGAELEKFKKPFLAPVMARGVSMTRGFPMWPKEGEATDHPHHTGVYFAHGEVNGKEYWSKLPITHVRFLKRVSGPVYARIVGENHWGEDLTEIQDITFLNAGEDVVMDWVITLKAENGPVVLGKTKEGGFSVRVAQGMTDKEGGKMVDAEGHEGEPAIREHSAVWADDYGKVDGKTVGVAIMDHPKSFRHPTDWHVRGYGLFAANVFFVKGDYEMKKGEAIVLRYRLYFHGGDAVEGKVGEVYGGYAD